MPDSMALPIGVEKLYVAVLRTDVAGSLIYGKPELHRYSETFHET